MELPDFVKVVVERIKRNPKVFAIYLFGSRAKGKEKVYSDWDICVLAENLTKEERIDISASSNEFVDVVLFDELPIWIQFEIFKYGKPIFVKDKKKLEKIKLLTLKWYLDYGKYFEVKLREKVRKDLKNLGIY